MSENKIVKSVNNMFQIAKNDIKSAFSHPLVIITLIGIIILPSLYANLNIMACWDPYANTDHLEIAVANSDQAATYGNITLNVGNEVVKELKKNDKFDWTFVSESDAREGVKSGRYYTAMIIPKNFSSNIASIDSDKPQPATLEYLVNEKTNPVASRMSDAASKELQRKVSNHIVKVLDVMAVEKLTILKTALASGSSKLNSGAAKVSSGASQVSSGSEKLKKGSKELKKGSKKLVKGSEKVSKGSKQLSVGSKEFAEKSKKLSDGAKKLSDGASKAKYGADEVNKGADAVSKIAKGSNIPDPVVKKVIVDGSEKVSQVSGEVSNGLGELSSGGSEVASGTNKLVAGTQKAAKGTIKLANGTNQVAQGGVKLADGSTQLADGGVKLADGAVALASGSSKLATASANALLTASDSLDGITSIDKDYLGDYFYSPVILKKNTLNHIKHYGSEVSPFYLILSIWVGCIVTCVMIKMRFLNDERYKPIEVYFGKMGFFLVMVLLQTTITMIWACSLGIEIENMHLFIFSMYVVGLVFMFLMYSLVSIFGLVGEGAAIVLLVLQISSTGGIYPVEVMPAFFKAIHLYLPMTYAITMIREACLGLYLPNYVHAISMLLIYPVVMFIIALIIKGAGRIDKKVNYVEEKLIESGLF